MIKKFPNKFSNRNNYMVTLLFWIISSISLFYTATVFAANQLGQSLDRIVAVVNTQVITQRQLNAAIAAFSVQLQQRQMPLPPETRLKQQVLQEMINHELQIQMIKRLKITVDEKELDTALEKIASSNNISLAKLKESLLEQHANYKQFRDKIKEQMQLHKLQQAALNKPISISETDVDQYLKNNQQPIVNPSDSDYHLVDLLVPLTESASAKDQKLAHQKAEELLKKMRQDPNHAQSHQQITDLGWRKQMELPSLFVQHVNSMKVGDLVGPIQAPNGYHILKLVGLKSGKGQPMSRTEIKEYLFDQQFNKQLEAWLAQVRNAAYIKIML